MLKILLFWIFRYLQLSVVFADDIDADYYFGSSYEVLRARDGLDCINPANQLYCKLQCKKDAGVCYASKCYCVYKPKPDLHKNSGITTHLDSPEQDVSVRYSPGRRHHIAHFCMNLEVARKCIRKCMKEGKPAFCGKDHVCYCGHRYHPHQKKDELDPEKIKNGFYDLYLKYFGPDTSLLPPPPKESNDKELHDENETKERNESEGNENSENTSNDDEEEQEDGSEAENEDESVEGSGERGEGGNEDGSVKGGGEGVADEEADGGGGAGTDGEGEEGTDGNTDGNGDGDKKEGLEERRNLRRKPYKFSL